MLSQIGTDGAYVVIETKVSRAYDQVACPETKLSP